MFIDKKQNIEMSKIENLAHRVKPQIKKKLQMLTENYAEIIFSKVKVVIKNDKTNWKARRMKIIVRRGAIETRRGKN